MTESELANMPYDKIVHNVILEKILQPSGQDIRGWRIGDNYMDLMADFGDYCYQQDTFTGGILLEIALQRLSKGAVLHEGSRFDILPKAYQPYSACYDQFGLMSNDCWYFLSKQYAVCLKANLTKEHTKKIIFGLIDYLDDKGNTLGDFSLGGMDFKTSPQEVFSWAWNVAKTNFSFEERYVHFATPQKWQRHKTFFKENWKQINTKDFFQKIGETGFFNNRNIRKDILK